MPKATPIPAEPFARPAEDEERTVHEVYEAIAPHFARTRFKPPGSLGLDSGAGNGKYLPVAADAGSSMIALDRSQNLLCIARGVGGECVRADLGSQCWRDGVFDYAISIAALHHLSTPDRRQAAVQTLLRTLRLSSGAPYARFMVYVWAWEQGANSRRKMGSAVDTPSANGHGDRPGTEAETTTDPAPALADRVQDVLVPWVLAGEDKVYHRYYHLFVAGELGELVRRAAATEGFAAQPGAGKWMRVTGEGWEADNWWLEGEVGL